MHNIRSARRADIPALLDAIAQLAAHHGDPCHASPETLTRDLFGPTAWGHALVAQTGQSDWALLGYAILLPVAQVQFGTRGMDLHHLFTWPSSRNAGVGTALLIAAQDHARKLGCAYLTVGTHPENHAAQRFYDRAGFARHAASPRFRIKL